MYLYKSLFSFKNISYSEVKYWSDITLYYIKCRVFPIEIIYLTQFWIQENGKHLIISVIFQVMQTIHLLEDEISVIPDPNMTL